MKNIKIGKYTLGEGFPCFIVAELSANHGGSIEQAKKLIEAAQKCGADAVKLQTYRPDTITLNCDKEDFLISTDNPWAEYKNLYQLYDSAYTPWEWHEELFSHARSLGLEIFSSPFDASAVDFLEELGVNAYKIASPEITDIPLLRKVGETKKPVVLSTGVAELQDIELAIETLKSVGSNEIIILKCTSGYPTPLDEVNLRTIADIGERWDCLPGLSDHTLGTTVPMASVILGARFIEKHFIIDKTDDSVDAFFSLDENQFSSMVEAVREAETCLGTVSYEITRSAIQSMKGRRSLYVSKAIKKGEVFTEQHVKSVRPAYGLHPKHFDDVIGCKAAEDLTLGDRISWDVIQK